MEHQKYDDYEIIQTIDDGPFENMNNSEYNCKSKTIDIISSVKFGNYTNIFTFTKKYKNINELIFFDINNGKKISYKTDSDTQENYYNKYYDIFGQKVFLNIGKKTNNHEPLLFKFVTLFPDYKVLFDVKLPVENENSVVITCIQNRLIIQYHKYVNTTMIYNNKYKLIETINDNYNITSYYDNYLILVKYSNNDHTTDDTMFYNLETKEKFIINNNLFIKKIDDLFVLKTNDNKYNFIKLIKKITGNECIICDKEVEEITHIFVPCGHTKFHEKCCNNIDFKIKYNNKCTCGEVIDKIIKIK
jgi:hypothetical protein